MKKIKKLSAKIFIKISSSVLILMITASALPVYAALEISLSFDDAPMRNHAIYTGTERTNKLIDILNKYKIQTVFYVISDNLDNDDGHNRMLKYAKAGHWIANHSQTHPNFDKLTIDEFKKNVINADKKIRTLPNFRPWFRFPMLCHGDTQEKQEALQSYLKEIGYKNGYVTLDVQDWFMASIIDEGVKHGKILNTAHTCKAYSELIWDTIHFYDKKAIELLQRSPKHTLLLHENDLAALCLEDLIKKIQKENGTIISPDLAMTDKIFDLQPKTLFYNNGLIAALYHEAKNIKIYDPWAYPWNDGQLIREEFNRRHVFEK
jgi:peptidoglycan/xylan/chitin deacetylase (PgdA/CDA1 family)